MAKSTQNHNQTPPVLRRLYPGATLGGLSRTTGVSVAMLSRVFNGKRQPGLDTLRKISIALGASLEVLDDVLARVRNKHKPARKPARNSR